jgi:hypothetical protein
MPINTQIIYDNGRYRVVPLVTLLALEGGGRRLGIYGVEDVDKAVMDADAMAERDGMYAHVAGCD